jgi:hypothetical protein
MTSTTIRCLSSSRDELRGRARLRVDTMFYFPASPPKVRTAFEPVYAPLRLLVGSAAFLALYGLPSGSRRAVESSG